MAGSRPRHLTRAEEPTRRGEGSPDRHGPAGSLGRPGFDGPVNRFRRRSEIGPRQHSSSGPGPAPVARPRVGQCQMVASQRQPLTIQRTRLPQLATLVATSLKASQFSETCHQMDFEMNFETAQEQPGVAPSTTSGSMQRHPGECRSSGGKKSPSTTTSWRRASIPMPEVLQNRKHAGAGGNTSRGQTSTSRTRKPRHLRTRLRQSVRWIGACSGDG